MIKFRCYFMVTGKDASESDFLELRTVAGGRIDRSKRIVDSSVGYGDWRYMSEYVESDGELPIGRLEQLLAKLCDAKSMFVKFPVRILQLQVTVFGSARRLKGVSLDPTLIKMACELNAVVDVSVAFKPLQKLD